jgi:hypothetical protein
MTIISQTRATSLPVAQPTLAVLFYVLTRANRGERTN